MCCQLSIARCVQFHRCVMQALTASNCATCTSVYTKPKGASFGSVSAFPARFETYSGTSAVLPSALSAVGNHGRVSPSMIITVANFQARLTLIKASRHRAVVLQQVEYQYSTFSYHLLGYSANFPKLCVAPLSYSVLNLQPEKGTACPSFCRGLNIDTALRCQ